MQFNYRIKYNYFLTGIGCIFLFNGNIGIFDFLPDFIGYILIAAGIGHLFLVNENFSKTRNSAYLLTFVTFAKFILSFFTGGFADEDMLLVTVLFNAAEFILAYGLFANLFAADELYFEMSGALEDSRDAGFYGFFMKIFLFVKYGIGILAEMTVLINPDFLDRLAVNNDIIIDSAQLARAAGFIGVIIATLFGIFMTTLIPPHFRRLSANEAVNDKLRVLILSVQDRDVKIKLRKYGLSFVLIYISMIFLFDLNIDGIILPDLLSALAILLVLVNMRQFFPAGQYKKAVAVISLLIITATVSFSLNIYAFAAEFELAFSASGDTFLNIASIASAIICNALLAAAYIFIYKSAERLRSEEMNLVKGTKGVYITREEFERKINPSAVNAFVIFSFAVKTFSLFNISYSFVPLAYFVICTFCVVFSFYKLDKIRTRIKYYYQIGSNDNVSSLQK